MLYQINFDNHLNFDIYEENKLAPRAYFIPYSDKTALKKTNCLNERFQSDMVHCLSGEWDFKYYEKTVLLPHELDTENTDFDKVTVPFDWQRNGYGEPAYINVPYEFDCCPPDLPEEMPVGVYRKKITVSDMKKNYVLCFLGVAGPLDLYVNGEAVGYSEGAHNSAEFELNKYLHEGENEIVAVIFKWSHGTYLECQDMFRENGIFRDVLLYEYPTTYINDYQIKTSKLGDTYDLSLQLDLIGNPVGFEVEVTISKGNKLLGTAVADADRNLTLDFKGLPAEEWTAETPNIYEMYITLRNGENSTFVIRNYTGFKSVEIVGEVFRFNGKAIKFKGVNHHDTNPKNGYVMSPADIKKDLTLMKAFNVNAIRTSHYPPDPILLQLADILGFYIVDEADIETHGTIRIPGKRPNMDLISHNRKWEGRYVDRVKRMYYRDRNHPSITMWSLGNEAGGYHNQDTCYEFLHTACPEIPVHYEAVCRTKRFAYDVVSEMYTSIAQIERVRDHKRGKKYFGKPFFLCEYCHAMGVGPGALEDYWQTFYSSDSLMGGCIWEWADHAVLHEKDSKYNYQYTYGGDHGERKHDGNFCVDGLMYPDRTPHTGAYEMQVVYRPLRAERKGFNKFCFTNTNRFRNSDYITVQWTLLKNGEAFKNGEMCLAIEPCGTRDITLDYDAQNKEDDYHINFTYLYSDGSVIAVEQITLNDIKPNVPLVTDGKLSVEESKNTVDISCENGKVIFSRETGTVKSFNINGAEYLNLSPAGNKTGFLPNIYRAPLDNDSTEGRGKWFKANIDKTVSELKDFSFTQNGDKVIVTSAYVLSALDKKIYNCTVNYTVYPKGQIEVKASLKKLRAGLDDLPRFGISFEIPREFEKVTYYGRGEKENLCDMNAQSPVGIYESSISDLYENYIKPQDCGNHGGTKWLKIESAGGKALMVYGLPKFSFNARHFTQQLMVDSRHREDIKEQNTTVINIDGFLRGTGTASCGPDTLEKYRFSVKNEITFKFLVSPC